MGAYGPNFYSDDLVMDVRREYGILLSVGYDNADVEKMLTDYYSSIFNKNDPDEEVFWFALALCEWKKGRLSKKVKERALCALESGRDLERWNIAENSKNYEKRKKVLNCFKNTILSPMPEPQKIKKATVNHCPWRVGSLLAYRIVSNKNLINNPCYMKYVLLRVIKINMHPLSRVFDTGYFDESMVVGLYDWIGSIIPDPEIVKDLNYIPISDYKIPNLKELSCLCGTDDESSNILNKNLNLLFETKTEKCVQLDWRSGKFENGDITFLNCDETFQNHIPAFFDPIHSNTLTHFLPFDITLSKIFE